MKTGNELEGKKFKSFLKQKESVISLSRDACLYCFGGCNIAIANDTEPETIDDFLSSVHNL